jgi:hypothetical protein
VGSEIQFFTTTFVFAGSQLTWNFSQLTHLSKYHWQSNEKLLLTSNILLLFFLIQASSDIKGRPVLSDAWVSNNIPSLMIHSIKFSTPVKKDTSSFIAIHFDVGVQTDEWATLSSYLCIIIYNLVFLPQKMRHVRLMSKQYYPFTYTLQTTPLIAFLILSQWMKTFVS